jgi:hypothetical protein
VLGLNLATLTNLPAPHLLPTGAQYQPNGPKAQVK